MISKIVNSSRKQNNQPERSKREDPYDNWKAPQEKCFHEYPNNTDSYRYFSQRGCRCKRDAVL